MLGVLLQKLADGEAEYVGMKVGEYGITLANFDDLMRVYGKMKCCCCSIIMDVPPDVLQKMRRIISMTDPYEQLAKECKIIPAFDIEKLRRTIKYQESGTRVNDVLKYYACESDSESVTCYWKLNGEPVITRMRDGEYKGPNPNLDDVDDADDSWSLTLMQLFTESLANDKGETLPQELATARREARYALCPQP
jgi:hypothetical protein